MWSQLADMPRTHFLSVGCQPNVSRVTGVQQMFIDLAENCEDRYFELTEDTADRLKDAIVALVQEASIGDIAMAMGGSSDEVTETITRSLAGGARFTQLTSRGLGRLTEAVHDVTLAKEDVQRIVVRQMEMSTRRMEQLGTEEFHKFYWINPARIRLGEQLGSGGFGKVFAATMTYQDEPKSVAVKVVDVAVDSRNRPTEDVRAELQYLLKAKRRKIENLVRLEGFCRAPRIRDGRFVTRGRTEKPGFWLVMERMRMDLAGAVDSNWLTQNEFECVIRDVLVALPVWLAAV